MDDCLAGDNQGYRENGEAFRNQIIDSFRGVAILSVMAFHYLNVDVGRFGVHVFFVISGLVISMTILKTGAALEFAVRRFARLFPSLLVCSLITYMIGSSLSFPDYLANLTFFPKVLGFQYVDASYWTLHIEIEFYALVAASYMLFRRYFWVGVIIAAALGLFGKYMAFFLLGMGIYFLVFKKDKLAAFFTGTVGLIAYTLYGIHLNLAENIYLIGCISILAGMLKFIPQFGFEPLAYVGRISYPLYLVHQNIGLMLIAQIQQAGGPYAAKAIGAASVICIGIAIVVHYVVEKPMKEIIVSCWHRTRAIKIAAAEL